MLIAWEETVLWTKIRQMLCFIWSFRPPKW